MRDGFANEVKDSGRGSASMLFGLLVAPVEGIVRRRGGRGHFGFSYIGNLGLKVVLRLEWPDGRRCLE